MLSSLRGAAGQSAPAATVAFTPRIRLEIELCALLTFLEPLYLRYFLLVHVFERVTFLTALGCLSNGMTGGIAVPPIDRVRRIFGIIEFILLSCRCDNTVLFALLAVGPDIASFVKAGLVSLEKDVCIFCLPLFRAPFTATVLGDRNRLGKGFAFLVAWRGGSDFASSSASVPAPLVSYFLIKPDRFLVA